MEHADRKFILRKITEVKLQITRLRREQEEAEKKLSSLKARLTPGDNEITQKPKHPAAAPVSAATNLTPNEKITLFLHLFKGREDVYPKLWQNQKTGKKGYSPACASEWVRGVCQKPRVKCGECPNQAFFPVTADTVLDHLKGRHVIGVYRILKDETS